MQVLEKVSRAISRNYGIQLIFKGTRAFTDGKMIVLPALPKDIDPENEAKVRGYCDHEIGHLLYSTFSKEYMERMCADPRLKNVTNALEDVRIEKLLGAKYPGAKVNMQRTMSRLIKQGIEQDRPIGLLSKLTVEGRRVLCGYDLPGESHAEEVAEAFGEDLFERLDKCESSEDVLALAKSILEKMEEPPASDDDGKGDGKGSGEAPSGADMNGKVCKGKGDGKGDGKISGPKEKEEHDDSGDSEGGDSGAGGDSDGGGSDDSDGGAPEGKDAEEEPEEEAGSEGDAESEDEHDDSPDGDGRDDSGDDSDDRDGGDDVADADEPGDDADAESDVDSDGADGDSPDGGDHDGYDGDPERDDTRPEAVEGTSTAMANALANGHLDEYDDLISTVGKEMEAEARAAISRGEYMVLDKTGDQVVVVSSNVAGAIGSFRRLKEQLGALNVARAKATQMFLTRTASRWIYDRENGKINGKALAKVPAGHKNVFKEKWASQDADTAVTLLCDFSGSMKYRVELQMAAVVLFLETLNGAGIKTEVLGYTTNGYAPGVMGIDRSDWGRVEKLMTYVFKTFNEPYNATVKGRIGNYDNLRMSENCDPCSVRVAYDRLIQRPEKRKILFVLSDGAVANMANHSIGRRELKRLVKEIRQKTPVEIYGIGMGVDVSDYYGKDFSMMVTMANLAAELFAQLKKIMKVK